MRSEREYLTDAELLYDFLRHCGPTPKTADLLLAAGSHDLRVPRNAAKLFLQGAAPWLICTGGLGKITDGLWTEPEGDKFARECRALGVPEERLLIERASTNTGENFRFSRQLLAGMGLRPRTGIIVCKPYMAKRCWATGSKQWPEVQWTVCPPPIPFADYAGADTPLSQEIQLMVGDLQRLQVYAEKGFQVPVPVPGDIWAAYERLVADGFDQQVIR